MAESKAETLAREFFRRVWAPPHELDAIDELMTPDYRITTAGTVVQGRAEFKVWVKAMQETVGMATNEHLEIFTNASGDRVVSRWVTRSRGGPARRVLDRAKCVRAVPHTAPRMISAEPSGERSRRSFPVPEVGGAETLRQALERP